MASPCLRNSSNCGAVAEDRRHAACAKPVHGGLCPLVGIGAPDGAGQDRDRRASEEGARNRRDELHGRITDEADRCGAIVGDALGDVFGARVHFLPGVVSPLAAFGVQYRQLGRGTRHRGR